MRVRIIPQGDGVNWYVVDRMIGPDKTPAVGFKAPNGMQHDDLLELLEQADILEGQHRRKIRPWPVTSP